MARKRRQQMGGVQAPTKRDAVMAQKELDAARRLVEELEKEVNATDILQMQLRMLCDALEDWLDAYRYQFVLEGQDVATSIQEKILVACPKCRRVRLGPMHGYRQCCVKASSGSANGPNRTATYYCKSCENRWKVDVTTEL